MTRLHLGLLGPPLVELAGQRLTFATAKARALLIYLALEPDRPHPRESLMTLFWDQSDDASARTSLRQALAVLRDALGDADRPEPFLLINRETVQLNPAADVTVDVHEFRRLILQSARQTGRPAVRVPAIATARERALALYRGDFLAGSLPTDSVPFAEWAVIWRERLHQQALEAAVGLAQHRELVADAQGAVRMWRRALALEPWREDAHLAVMRLLAASGERSAALAQYTAARKVLADELAIEPGQALRDLRAAIEHEDGALLAPLEPLRAPAAGGDLIGREAELEQLAEWLLDANRRVITVHGPGGVGKTRLALTAARRNAVVFPDGAVTVALAAISDPALVPDAVLGALGIEANPDHSLDDQVRAALRDQALLLVLDNADHLLPALGEVIAAWLGAASGLTVLVTSRTRLGLQTEWVLPLRGLRYAASGPSGPDDAAAALFVMRVQRHRPDYTIAVEPEALGRLCRCVEGLPLALELAASLNPERSVDEIATALETQQPVLAASWPDAPERHRSVAAVFEYSWRALACEAQRALAHCAVFRGSFAASAVAQVLDLPTETAARLLALLVDRAVMREADAGRYDLHELMRAFALHKLDEFGATRVARDRHLAYFLAESRRAEDADPEHSADAHLALRVDLGNLRAALEHALAVPDALAAAELATAFSVVFWRMGLMVETQSWLTRAIDALETEPESARRDRALARALNEIGAIASLQFRLPDAERYLERALQLARRGDDPVFLARVLAHLARNFADTGAFDRAEALMLEGLRAYEAGGSAIGVARSYMTLGEIAQLRLASSTAEGYYRNALERVRALDSRSDLAILLANLGMLLGEMDQSVEGQRLLEESIEVARSIGHDYVVAAVQAPLAGLHVQVARRSADEPTREHHLARARELALTAIRATHAQGIGLFLASGILQLAEIEAVSGHAGVAARLLGASEMARGLAAADWEVTHRALCDRLQSELSEMLGPAAFSVARAEGAALSLDEALSLAQGSNVSGSAV